MTDVSNSTHSLKDIDQAYSAPTWWYDIRGFLILTFAYRSSIFRQIKLFGTNIKGRHLEVAVGTGTLLVIILMWLRFQKRIFNAIVAFDYANTMLDGARRRFKKNQKIELLNADAADLPFEDKTFDSANIANAFHCLPDPQKAITELFRVLKPGAEVAVNVIMPANGVGMVNWLSRKIMSWGQRKGLLKRPYTIEETRTIFLNANFVISYEEISGNTYDLKAKRP